MFKFNGNYKDLEHKFGDRYGLMELRAKTRGYSLCQFEEAFCKLV